MAAVRREILDAHRIVVKVGTHVVTHNGIDLALGRLMALVESLAHLRNSGKEVLLVSSGAVGMGMRALGLKERPRSLGLRQACASVGQGHLMSVYTQAFSALSVTVGQVLLTQEDLGDRDRALCLRTTLMRLLELGVLPILNENDSVSVRELVEYRARRGERGTEIVFGDNDGLSARVAVSIDADLLILLTDVDGVFTADPSRDTNAERIRYLECIDASVLSLASGGSAGGTGGMLSKLEAARDAVDEGLSVVIANGSEPGIVDQIMNGEDVGTWVSTQERRSIRLQRIAVRSPQKGALTVNEGALQAITDRKASLLPVGVVAVAGEFVKGDVVEVRDESGRVIGRGLVNYDAVACRKILGRRSEDIDSILGYRGYDALITRDNLVLGLI